MSNVPEEVKYREVPGFPNYRVGDDGSVWCNLSRNGKGLVGLKWRRLRPRPLSSGHLSVGIRFQGVVSKFLVHRLVLLAFVGPCPDGMEACHFPDRDPTNNRLGNLRWDTHQGNMDDMVTHGMSNQGERHPLARLTAEQVKRIRDLYSTGKYSQRRLGSMFDVDGETVGSVVRRKSWRHL